jgi:hypothetical protein
VDKQCGIAFACITQVRAAYKSRLNIDKENSCPPPNNIAGTPMKHKKSLTASSPAIFANSTSSLIAPLAKKFVAVKSTSKKGGQLSKTSMFSVSGTAGCKCTGCEEIKAGVVYKLDCYHCEGSFKLFHGHRILS